MVDDFGRVFFIGNKVYRAIYKQSIPFCLDLLNADLFQRLVHEGFIPKTTLSEVKLEGYELILEHEKLSEIQLHEWSFEMIKEAACMILRLNKICNEYGYELKDAHAFNVLFRGTKPVYADIGSIAKKQGSHWRAYHEFVGVFYLPLLFWSKQEFYIARKLVESNFYKMQTLPVQSILDSQLMTLLDDKLQRYHFRFRGSIVMMGRRFAKIPHWIAKIGNKAGGYILGRSVKAFYYGKHQFEPPALKDMQKMIESMTLAKKNSEWGGYHQNNYISNNSFQPSERFLKIVEFVREIEGDVDSVIDLAGNEGFFTKLLLDKTKIPKLTVVDYDSNAIDSAYRRFLSENTDRVNVGLLNFIFSTDIEGTARRFKSDLAIALAVTHHLILKQNYSLDVIFDRLRMFSNKYVFVEFMPLGLWSAHTQTGTPPPDWYSFEWFKSRFEIYFNIMRVEQLEKNRILFVGKIKKGTACETT